MRKMYKLVCYAQIKLAKYQGLILSSTLPEFKEMMGPDFCAISTDHDLGLQWRKTLESLLPGGTLHKEITDDFKALQMRYPKYELKTALSPSPGKRMRAERYNDRRTPPSPIVPGFSRAYGSATCDSVDSPQHDLIELEKKYIRVIDIMQVVCSPIFLIHICNMYAYLYLNVYMHITQKEQQPEIEIPEIEIEINTCVACEARADPCPFFYLFSEEAIGVEGKCQLPNCGAVVDLPLDRCYKCGRNGITNVYPFIGGDNKWPHDCDTCGYDRGTIERETLRLHKLRCT